MPNRRQLLDAILGYQPGAIYQVASKRLVQSAMLYLQQERIFGFRWVRNGQALQAFVSGPTRYEVETTIGGGQLVNACTCARPSKPESLCAHALATRLLLLRVLKGARFHDGMENAEYLEAIRQQILSDAPKEKMAQEVYSEALVVLPKPGAAFPLLRMEKDGKLSGARHLFPRVLHPALNISGGDALTDLGAFLSWVKDDDGIPVFVQGEGVRHRVERSAPEALMIELSLLSKKEGVHLIVRTTDMSGEDVGELISCGTSLLFAPERGVFAQILNPEAKEVAAWLLSRPGEVISPGTYKPDPDKLVQLDTEVLSKGEVQLLNEEGERVEPAELEPTFTLSLAERFGDSDEEDGVIEGKLSMQIASTPTHHVFEFMQRETRLLFDREIIRFLDSDAKRHAVSELAGRMLLGDSESDRAAVISQIPDHPAIGRHPTSVTLAERILRRIETKLCDEGDIIAPVQGKTGWAIVPRGRKKLGETIGMIRSGLQAAPAYNLHGGETPFLMKKPGFLSRLASMLSHLTDQGVRLLWEGHPIETAKLQISVDAVSAGDIDWFELRPEVMCDGLKIPQSQWEQLMMGRLFEAKDGVVRIIELDSIKKLEHLAKMLGQSEDGKKRKGKKNAPIPRLHLFDWISARAAGIECRLPPSEEKLLKSLLSFEGIPELPVPSGLNAKLRDYQRRGYEWMAFLYKHRFGACLADDMGLGKTVQTITLLGAVREKLVTQPGGSKPLPHLIVLPPTLLFNWRHEIETFYPGINVVDYLGGNRKAQFSPGDVVLTTYELARRDIDILKHITFDVMVFDEAQAIKNLAGARSQAMRHLQARFKLCLTGTPLENHAGEYYSILELALPGLFGSYEGFRASLRNGGTILQRAKPFVLRRTKEKILKELPPKVESDIYLDLTETQREFYTRAVGEVREEVLAAYGDRTAQQAGIVALAALTRLRQICISPAIIDPAHEERSPKLEQLLEQLEELVAEGHAGIVFSQYVRALDLLDKELKAAKMPFLRMDGSTPTLDRKGLVKQFQEGSGPSIFLISLKTGGAGLNLTRASHVFHLDPWWNPAVENQASDRAHRIGQKNTVFIHRLLMRHTVEEKMMELKRKKQDLFRQIVENSESPTGGAMITKEDFTFLLGQ